MLAVINISGLCKVIDATINSYSSSHSSDTKIRHQKQHIKWNTANFYVCTPTNNGKKAMLPLMLEVLSHAVSSLPPEHTITSYIK